MEDSNCIFYTLCKIVDFIAKYTMFHMFFINMTIKYAFFFCFKCYILASKTFLHTIYMPTQSCTTPFMFTAVTSRTCRIETPMVYPIVDYVFLLTLQFRWINASIHINMHNECIAKQKRYYKTKSLHLMVLHIFQGKVITYNYFLYCNINAK